jgi:hypothetical protein
MTAIWVFWRAGAAAALALAAGACTYSSAVDLAPFDQRSAFAQITPGTYCPVERTSEGAGAAMITVSQEDCGRIAWDRAAREVRYEALGGAAAPETTAEASDNDADRAAILRLRPGLFLAQTRSTDPADETPFDIMLLLVTRDAVAAIETLPDGPLAALARRHPAVRFRMAGERPEIVGGAREDIHRFLVDAAALAVKFQQEDAEPPSIIVRDPARGTAHPPTGRQRRAIEAIDRLATDLAREAPQGIVNLRPDAPPPP